MSTTTILSKDGDDTIEITISTTPFYGVGSLAYWGWMATSAMLTEAQVVVLQASGSFDLDANITANFSAANASPQFLYMAERESEPVKTKWYASEMDQGSIGAGETFNIIGVVNGWRIYRSSYATQFSTSTIFKVS